MAEVYDQAGLDAARGNAPASNPFAGAGGSPGGGGPGGSFHFSSTGGGPHQFSSADAFNLFNQFGGFEDIFGGMGGSGGSSRGGSPFGGAQFSSSSMPGGFSSSGFGGMPQQQQQQQQTRRRREPEVVDLNVPCTLEQLYTGATKKMKIKRRGPSGELESTIIPIQLKPGWKSGTKITYKDMGDWHDGQRQTVRFIITEKPDPTFKREGNDLRTKVKLSFKESLLGYQKQIATIDGRKVPVSKSTPTQPGSVTRYPNLGMPISKTPGGNGDLIVEFDVDYPIYLSDTQKAAIRSSF
ncbi:hypothetical protein FOA43_001930 [Brettanomyces nanus]|uniref:Chaperone DnaJ C-terminal domain-containing protein n=1 Tax=Eeniella nana TaxID=13502 RepID=A0A875S4A1_EENNA|nr:uncharacterized protein FOA43_001930 [Brettanomyces nanus]QPG74599.1 hypothetical protein FOA43_001930 [Brettanomyces nanus]